MKALHKIKKSTSINTTALVNLTLVLFLSSCGTDSSDVNAQQEEERVVPQDTVVENDDNRGEDLEERQVIVVSDTGDVTVLGRDDDDDFVNSTFEELDDAGLAGTNVDEIADISSDDGEEASLEDSDQGSKDEGEPEESTDFGNDRIDSGNEGDILSDGEEDFQNAEDFIYGLNEEKRTLLSKLVEEMFGDLDLDGITLIDYGNRASKKKKKIVFFEIPGLDRDEVQGLIDSGMIDLKVITYVEGVGRIKLKIKRKWMIASGEGLIIKVRVSGLYRLRRS